MCVNAQLLTELCGKLMNIESMDLAEQALLCLQKIAREQPAAVSKAGGLTAILSFIDFFPASVQLTVMETAVCLSKKIPRDCFDSVLGVVPNVLPHLDRIDERMTPLAVAFFAHTLECFNHRYFSLDLCMRCFLLFLFIGLTLLVSACHR